MNELSQETLSDIECAETEALCRGCAVCCRYVSVRVPRPSHAEDVDTLTWHLYHGVEIFIDDAGWHLKFNSDCKHLNGDGECSIYENRPDVCREYLEDECERRNDNVFWKVLTTPEALQAYLSEHPSHDMIQ